MTASNSWANQSYDVCVIGGGPAGSTAATYLAMQGHSVLQKSNGIAGTLGFTKKQRDCRDTRSCQKSNCDQRRKRRAR